MRLSLCNAKCRDEPHGENMSIHVNWRKKLEKDILLQEEKKGKKRKQAEILIDPQEGLGRYHLGGRCSCLY